MKMERLLKKMEKIYSYFFDMHFKELDKGLSEQSMKILDQLRHTIDLIRKFMSAKIRRIN